MSNGVMDIVRGSITTPLSSSDELENNEYTLPFNTGR
jgi:hypothetical protein